MSEANETPSKVERTAGSLDSLVGHLFENGTVWAIVNHEGKIVAKGMSDTTAKEIVCERMDCEWEFAHRLGFRAVVAKEQYLVTGVLHELPNGGAEPRRNNPNA